MAAFGDESKETDAEIIRAEAGALFAAEVLERIARAAEKTAVEVTIIRKALTKS